MRKMEVRSKAVTTMIGFVIAVLVVFSKEAVLQTRAAQTPQVTNLEVTASTDDIGVIARCSYQNYIEQSGYEMKLYLYRIESGGGIIESQKELSYAVQGSDNTQSKQVSDGIYQASVTIDDGIEIRQINSLNYYQVSRNGDDYIIIEIAGSDEKEQLEQKNDNKEKSNSCSSHVCDYFLIEPATPEKDAVQAYQCIDCGTVLEL